MNGMGTRKGVTDTLKPTCVPSADLARIVSRFSHLHSKEKSCNGGHLPAPPLSPGGKRLSYRLCHFLVPICQDFT